MAVTRYDLIVDQGSDYERTFPVLGPGGQTQDITGWTVSGQIRDSYAPTAALLQTLTVTVSGSNVVLQIPKTVSRDWTWRLARYDVEITTPGGATTRFLEGSVVVHPEITR